VDDSVDVLGLVAPGLEGRRHEKTREAPGMVSHT
jgi:hypothetical protein